MQIEMALKRGRAVTDDAKQIWDDAELLLNALQQ
jgi:hypothetical protein